MDWKISKQEQMFTSLVSVGCWERGMQNYCSVMFALFFYPLGTKVMWLEGGCVCCVVLVTGCDLSTSKDGTIAVNSVSVPCDVK